MKRFVIEGGHLLKGQVTISGAKNSAVALIPASILADSPVTLEGIPDIEDVYSLMDILKELNVETHFDPKTHVFQLDATKMVNRPIREGKVKSLRASYYFMGALLARYGHSQVGFPGGDAIGPRPIDLHVKGFRALGAEVTHDEIGVKIDASTPLHGADIYLDLVSVGATMNILLAAVKAEGQTIIENAAREPEIIDMANFLNQMGAKVKGAGTSTIRVEGVKELHGVSHSTIPDRIEAGTYLALAAGMGDGVDVENVLIEHLEAFIAKLGEMGVRMDVYEDHIYVHPANREKLQAIKVKTMPFPGFATDLQQPITPLLLMATGNGLIEDTIHPKRTSHIPELQRMGAQAKVVNDTIQITGPSELHGAEVTATDLRAGVSLVSAALMAEGTSTIYGVKHILRGYENIVEKLTQLGANIKYLDD